MLLLIKFIFVSVLLFPTLIFAEMFTDNECLEQNFSVKVKHKANLFGFVSRKVFIEKKQCSLIITHNSWKYIDNRWLVDICREPVHIKYGTGVVEAYKKISSCANDDSGKFCGLMSELINLIQDDGLIYANGIKENLNSDHGKVYCSYVLLKKYLEDSFVFNVGQKYSGILTSKKAIQIQPTSNYDEVEEYRDVENRLVPEIEISKPKHGEF